MEHNASTSTGKFIANDILEDVSSAKHAREGYKRTSYKPSETLPGMFRRNGKSKSCEPCRKSKIRCDHSLPKYAKCRSCGIVDQCYYHPAPLTRPRSEVRADLARWKGINIIDKCIGRLMLKCYNATTSQTGAAGLGTRSQTIFIIIGAAERWKPCLRSASCFSLSYLDHLSSKFHISAGSPR